MNFKIIGLAIVIAIIIISSSIIITQQGMESQNRLQVKTEKFDSEEWNNEATRILPKQGELGNEWVLLWSDATKKFIQSEAPIIIRKTIGGNEIISTSYSYAHKDFGTYQILIWKGDLVSEWNPKDAVENIFLQTNAKTEKILQGLDLIPNCVVAYYDYYGESSEIKNDLLFSECAKKDFRIRVNLVEGEYNQESINAVVFLSNNVVGKI